jgi:hypothetical protein
MPLFLAAIAFPVIMGLLEGCTAVNFAIIAVGVVRHLASLSNTASTARPWRHKPLQAQVAPHRKRKS